MNGIFDGFFGTILGWGRMGSKSDQLHNVVRSYVHISYDDDVDDDDDDQWSIVIVDLRGYKSVNKREHTEHIFGREEYVYVVRPMNTISRFSFSTMSAVTGKSHLFYCAILYTYIG